MKEPTGDFANCAGSFHLFFQIVIFISRIVHVSIAMKKYPNIFTAANTTTHLPKGLLNMYGMTIEEIPVFFSKLCSGAGS